MSEMFTMPNGLRVVTEYRPEFPSVHIGFWIASGSIFERPEENGFSHYIEHMLFKSTANRTAKEIAAEMDALGGQTNAFTSKECTCFYTKVIDEHLERAVSLLSDMLLHPLMATEEFEKERGVILEEIAMSEDTPEDLVSDLLSEAYFGKHPLAQTILGSYDQIAALDREKLLEYKARHYCPDNAVLSVVGRFDMNALRQLCDKYLGDWQGHGHFVMPEGVHQGAGQLIVREKDIEQVHMCIAFPGIAQTDEKKYPLAVLNGLFGGGTSSRLFQRIREEMGAVYSVYSGANPYASCGSFEVYAAASPESAQKVADEIDHQISLLVRDGVNEKEFAMSKEQTLVSFKLGCESLGGRMSSLGKNMLMFGKTEKLDEMLDHINSVTIDSVNALIPQIFTSCGAAAAVGRNVKSLELLKR